MNEFSIPMPGAALPASAANSNFGLGDALVLNSVRLSTVCEKLYNCTRNYLPSNAALFTNLCISCSRGIDFAITNNDTPVGTSNLLKVCKLVCQRRSDCNLQAAIMVLMVTMKHACKANWFSAEESQEIFALAEEVTRIFNTHEGVNSEQTIINPTVSQIMSRYYPRIKLVHVLACVNIEPGFEACATDFHLTKNMPHSERKIRLLVAMKDNIDTSSCIITPPKVNIMINGRVVPGRMIGQMELGPQLPTVVSPMLKFGTNLLQAVGHFESHYTVLIASMSDIPASLLPIPEDYAQPASVAVESDAEVVEGSSRVSLNCPYSFTRIKNPAKGMQCKHLQCFDFSNYVEINTQCPYWKCPHCNQPISYPDIRIDKKMSMILQEVAEGIVSVIIHLDGSWEAIPGNDDHNKDESKANPTEALQEGSDQPLASEIPNEASNNVYDLTQGDDDNIIIINDDMAEDTKPILQTDLPNTATYMGPLENLSGQPNGGPSHYTIPPVLTDSVTPAVMQRFENYLRVNQQYSPTTGVRSASNATQLQQAPLQQMQGVNGGNQYYRYVMRVPNAIQSLPAQRPWSSPMVSTRPAVNTLSGNTSLPWNVVESSSAAHTDTFQQPQISNTQQYSTAQMRHLTSFGRVINQLRPSTPAQFPNNSSFRPNSGSRVTNQPRSAAPAQTRPSNGFRSDPGPQIANQPQTTTPVQDPNDNSILNSSPQIANQTQTPSQIRPYMISTPPHLRARTQVPPGGSVDLQQYRPIISPPVASAQQAGSPRTRQLPTAPIQIQSPRVNPASVPSVGSGLPGRTVGSRTEDVVGVQSLEQNWQSSGRMRGSITGRALSENYSQFIIRPTHTTVPNPPGQSLNQVNQPMLGNQSLNGSASSQPNPSQNNGG